MQVLSLFVLVSSALSQNVSIYDETGQWGECAEGSKEYMENCVYKTDYLLYIMAENPKISDKTCAELGFDRVSVDPVFSFDMYWKGGPAAFGKLAGPYLKAHPDLMPLLQGARDRNPACKTKGDTQKPEGSLFEYKAARIAWYDATGKHPECAEGPTKYMTDCVMKSNFFAYIRMWQPTVVEKTCAELGYETTGADAVFNPMDMYWKGGPAGFKTFGGKYLPGHPDIFSLLNSTRLANPACTSRIEEEIIV